MSWDFIYQMSNMFPFLLFPNHSMLSLKFVKDSKVRTLMVETLFWASVILCLCSLFFSDYFLKMFIYSF